MGDRGWDIDAVARVAARNLQPRQPSLWGAGPVERVLPVQRALQPMADPTPAPASAILSPWRWGDGVLVVRIPVKTKNEANLSSPHAKFAVPSYRKQVRAAVRAALVPVFPRWTELPVVVTLTRHGAGVLDPHDGLPNAFKSVVDEIAEWLPLPKKPGAKGTLRADDSDPRVTWKYDQQKAKPGTAWVTACFVARAT